MYDINSSCNKNNHTKQPNRKQKSERPCLNLPKATTQYDPNTHPPPTPICTQPPQHQPRPSKTEPTTNPTKAARVNAIFGIRSRSRHTRGPNIPRISFNTAPLRHTVVSCGPPYLVTHSGTRSTHTVGAKIIYLADTQAQGGYPVSNSV